MNKIYRILGKHGRVTIPYYLRILMEYKANDVVSFRVEGDEIIVKREKICDACQQTAKLDVNHARTASLHNYLDSLSPEMQEEAFAYLCLANCKNHNN